jgi:hypothetical protein
VEREGDGERPDDLALDLGEGMESVSASKDCRATAGTTYEASKNLE